MLEAALPFHSGYYHLIKTKHEWLRHHFLCASPPLFSGDIGGQMGLFIGASILTVLEILDYIYEVECLRGPTHITVTV